MSILDKFKKKKPLDQKLENTENSIEEVSLADKIQDDTVEMGIPQDLSPSKKNNVNKVAMAGIGIVAIGLIVSGLIAFGSGSSDSVAQNTQPLDEIKNNQPKDFEQDKDQLALQLPEQASEPVIMEEEVQAESQAEPDQTAQSTEQKEPEETPRQRKMRGNVLVDFDGGQSTGDNTGVAEARPVSFTDNDSDSSS